MGALVSNLAQFLQYDTMNKQKIKTDVHNFVQFLLGTTRKIADISLNSPLPGKNEKMFGS
jgi:hypothetical protein